MDFKGYTTTKLCLGPLYNLDVLEKEQKLRFSLGYEIFDQVVHIANQSQEHYGIPLSNIVYMGMGEPLLNYKNVLESVERVTSENGLGMSPRRITVSTAGIAKMIHKLGDDKVRFNLALSLHAANEKKRDYIMPINETSGRRRDIHEPISCADVISASR